MTAVQTFSSPRPKNGTGFATGTPPGSPATRPGSEGYQHNTLGLDTENQWLEPEISRADFDAVIAMPDGTTYPSVEHGLAAPASTAPSPASLGVTSSGDSCSSAAVSAAS
ncbi:hypothetical protein ACFT7S_16360 [Streptomyces sp. NPDC057136]|uniref:hypothetical protein n=1 Tax=Streptomyces sp. NPDC057136 TaxID=3346029 RepID=UPI00364379CE